MPAQAPTPPASPFRYASEAYRTLSDRDLSDLARAGDEAAAWALTERVEGVIQKAVRDELRDQPRPACVDVEDFLSCAREEVQKAMRKWEAGDGLTFHLQAYAATVARRSVQDQMAANAAIPADRETRRTALKIGEQARQFAEERGRDPEPRELAAIVGKSVGKVGRAMVWLKHPVPLDQLCGSDGDGEHSRSRNHEPATAPEAAPDAAYLKKDLWEVLQKGFSELSPRQQFILTGIYELELPAAELRRALKISKTLFRDEKLKALAFLKACAQ